MTSKRHRPMRHLECLENRSLLSSVPLSGFPAVGFRTSVLDGTPPWSVSVLIDGQPAVATGFAETSELIGDAPALPLAGIDSLWIAGIIGDTRLHGPRASTNDVDLYRIDLPGGHYALSLRALAQQFGSALDPAVSLFDSVGQLLASNDDAFHVGWLSDSELFAGLNGGTYYIAVSAGGNLPGEDGGFSPLVPGSGRSSRGGEGQYLLQVAAVPDSVRPEVVKINIEPHAPLTEPLTEITVQFSEPMDLQGLQHGAALVGPNGSIALSSGLYNSDTFEVTYRLNEGLAAGDYVFTLSAAQVTDRADNPIAGAGLDGGYALQFSVDSSVPNRQDTEPNGTFETAQDLGPLYRNELRSTVTINGAVNTNGDQDFYRFHVNRQGFFEFRLRSGAGTNQTSRLMIRDADGQLLGQGFRFPGSGCLLLRLLEPGDYVLQIDGAGVVPGSYTLTIHGGSELEVPLMDNSVGHSVSAVLTTHDGDRVVPEHETEASAAPIVIATDAMAYSVGSIPTVASQPVGRPQPLTAGSVELAWVDISSERRVLPEGIVLHRPTDTDTRFSVASVSGSFLEPLPETVFGGMNDSNAARPLGTDLRAAVAALWQSETSQVAERTQVAEWNGQNGSGHYAYQSDDDSSDEHYGDTQTSSSPSTLAFGMLASVGAVGAAAAPNRRRPMNWMQHAFDWLGLEV